MGDAEYVFKQDCRDKKSVGRSASKKVRNKKGCNLPSDYMSKKEIRGMNEEVISMNLNRPMSWTKFKFLPKDLQEQYINSLHEKYGCTYNDLSRMFGLGRGTFSRYVKTVGLSVFESNKGARLSDEAGWGRFVHPEKDVLVPTDGSIPVSDLAVPAEGHDASGMFPEVTETVESRSVEDTCIFFNSCSYDFEGLQGIDDVIKLIKRMPWRGKVRVQIDISCGG